MMVLNATFSTPKTKAEYDGNGEISGKKHRIFREAKQEEEVWLVHLESFFLYANKRSQRKTTRRRENHFHAETPSAVCSSDETTRAGVEATTEVGVKGQRRGAKKVKICKNLNFRALMKVNTEELRTRDSAIRAISTRPAGAFRASTAASLSTFVFACNPFQQIVLRPCSRSEHALRRSKIINNLLKLNYNAVYTRRSTSSNRSVVSLSPFSRASLSSSSPTPRCIPAQGKIIGIEKCDQGAFTCFVAVHRMTGWGVGLHVY
jgi:hypothetical protein